MQFHFWEFIRDMLSHVQNVRYSQLVTTEQHVITEDWYLPFRDTKHNSTLYSY